MLTSEAERILDLPQGGVHSPETLKIKYRSAARRCHPDKGGTDEQMAKVNEAYNVLSSVKPRAKADWSAIFDAAKSELQKGSEATFQRHLVTHLKKEHDAKVIKIHGHQHQAIGLPDLYVASLEWTGWLELKWQDGKVSDIQKKQLHDLTSRAVSAFVVRGRADGAITITLLEDGRANTITSLEQLVPALIDLSNRTGLIH